MIPHVSSGQRFLRILPAILLAASGLITGIWTGWIRMGWDFPIGPLNNGLLHHGSLMIGGLLGTVILLERVTVVHKKWLIALPVINGLSVPAFLLHYPEVAFICLGIGGLGLTGLFIYFCEKYKNWDQYLLLVGALCYLIGTVLLGRMHLYVVVFPWWMAFLLWTIAGERMELSRFLMVRPWQRMLLIAALTIFLIGCGWPYHGGGSVLMGLGLAGTGAWLLRFDMARKSIRKPGAFRFTGTALLIGYGWLLVAASLMVLAQNDMLWYDAVLHSFFIGFVFSMVFAHGPIIFPALIGKPGRPHHPLLWFWLFLLHAGLIIRVLADLITSFGLRQCGGLLNGIAIVGFGVTLAWLIGRLRKDQPASAI